MLEQQTDYWLDERHRLEMVGQIGEESTRFVETGQPPLQNQQGKSDDRAPSL